MLVKIGNIFESKCSALVNTVNCVGVMGKGIACEFKRRYPDMFMDYVLKCSKENVKPGVPYVYHDKDGLVIINFPTKDHWRSPSRLSYVVNGLDWIVENYEKYHIKSIAFPPLGCGNGGLSWDIVGPVMYQKLSILPIQIEIYAPFGTPQKELSKSFLTGKQVVDEAIGSRNMKINPKWYLILEIIREVNNRRYSLKVGRTIYQKICFVLTRNGVETGFNFSKGTYGPYSPGVKESIETLANANLIIEKQLGRMISMSVSDDVVIDKNSFTAAEWEAMTKTVDLFGRVKSTGQAEVIATVLFSYDQLVMEKREVSDKDVYDYVLDWKPRWKEEKEFEVCDSIHNLAMLSLMDVTFSHQLMETV
ncbi:MAG: macro domain-containing protein [Lachnospiraceae bacterium]|nr:macro domain-containing protein [Lachnospiraceae bacterium]